MATFRNDYSEGAHPQILDALVRTNAEATCGYGRDEYCIRAAQAVRARFACPTMRRASTATGSMAFSAALRRDTRSCCGSRCKKMHGGRTMSSSWSGCGA